MRLTDVNLLLLFAVCLTVGCATADGQSTRPVEYKLPNGLHVILRPVAGAQQTAVVTLFSVGGDHDPEGASGLGHFIEHLYVTAAAGDVPVRTVESLVQSHPAGWNAQTGDDFTVYATVVDPSALENEIKDHSQRMGDLRITDADLHRELPRIEQELDNMFGRIPAIAASNLARERVRPTPLKGRKGGQIDQLKRVTLEQLQSRWQQLYKPANATLVIAGALDPTTLRPIIESAFGQIPSGTAAPIANAVPKQDDVAGVKTETVKPIQPGMASNVALTFAAPKPDSTDYAPFLIVVNRLLVQNQRAGFPLPLTEPQLRFAFLDDPNVLSVATQLKTGESADDAAAHLRAFVDQALSSPWNNNERMATKQNLAMFLDTVPLPDQMLAMNAYGVAFGLGRRHQLGISGNSLAKQLDRVTADEAKRVGERYLSSSHGAVAAVLTKPSK